MKIQKKKKTFKLMNEHCVSVVEEIENRFNDGLMNIMMFASNFESLQSLINVKDADILKFCDNFHILDGEAVIADFRSFNFVIKSMLYSEIYNSDESPLIQILEADVGYFELKKLCDIFLAISVTT